MEPTGTAADWPQTFDEICALCDAGRLEEARTLCETFLARNGEHPEALLQYGSLWLESGAADRAMLILERAAALAPADPEVGFALGTALAALGRLDEALAAYERTLALDANFAEAHANRARVLLATGQSEAAEVGFRQALALDAKLAEAWAGLAQVLLSRRQHAEAVQSYQHALALGLAVFEVYLGLGTALLGLGRAEEAEAPLRQAVAAMPTSTLAHSNLGVALRRLGRLSEAEQCLGMALDLAPESAEAHNNLGLLKIDQNQPAEALSVLERALELRPDYGDAHNNLGIALLRCGRLAEAEARFRQTVALLPASAFAHLNLGRVLLERLRLDEAIACFRQSLVLEPELLAAHSNLLFALQYREDPGHVEQRDALLDLGRVLGKPPRPAIDRAAGRRLRIGYVSPDLREHSCAWFLAPLLAQHDRQRFEIFCYSAARQSDWMSDRLRAQAEHWHSLTGLSGPQAVRVIRDHGIDVLVDLAGHTADNRLDVFALAAAPVQVSWLGFPGSTGLAAVDYRLSDPWLTPADTMEPFIETVWNLERPTHCWQAPPEAPEVAPLPALERGTVTFGSFNNLAKASERTFDLWAKVLTAVPTARLLLKSVQTADPGVQERLRQTLAERKIDPTRVEFLGRTPGMAAHLACYARVDIALDTFPYNGATTTMEALWMGVPVVSRVGDRTASRYGLSFLQAVGLGDLAVADDDAYVAVAARLASNPPVLARWRARLRQAVAASPLCDATGFARAIEAAFVGMVRRRLADG